MRSIRLLHAALLVVASFASSGCDLDEEDDELSVETALVTVSSSAELQAALNKAQPGQTIVVKNGTYTGPFVSGGTAGTKDKPITVKAESRHGATIAGNGGGIGFTLQKPFWRLEGFRITKFETGVSSKADHQTIAHNLIYDLKLTGIRLGASDTGVDHNVIGLIDLAGGEKGVGIKHNNGGKRNVMEHNVLYGINDDGCQGCFTPGVNYSGK
jgi:nitrous oxidase accessory protein NosD